MFDGSKVLLERLESEVVSEILGDDARRIWDLGDLPSSLLQPYLPLITELSQRYLTGGRTVPRRDSARDSALLDAYALYYLLINTAKVGHLLPQLGSLLDRPLRVLDFGSGPASASLALTLASSRRHELTLIDLSPSALELGSRLLGRLSATCCCQAELPDGKFDLILACNVLAENSDRRRLFRELLERRADGGVLLIVEPGTPMATRPLMELRDTAASDHPETRILFPCTRSDPCPMLRASETDWCHGEIKWERPRLIRRFDTLLGFNKHRIKYSALALGSGRNSSGRFRVLRPSKRVVNGHEIELCGPGWYGAVTLPKRERVDGNRALTGVEQYDLVDISGWDRTATIVRGTRVSPCGLPISDKPDIPLERKIRDEKDL